MNLSIVFLRPLGLRLAQTWAGLVRLIRQLLAQGKAVISVTHDQDYIDALGGASYQLTAAERGSL